MFMYILLKNTAQIRTNIRLMYMFKLIYLNHSNIQKMDNRIFCLHKAEFIKLNSDCLGDLGLSELCGSN